MRIPWKYENGLSFIKCGLLFGKKYLFLNTAFLVEYYTWIGLYPDVGPLYKRLIKKLIGFISTVYAISACFSSGYPLFKFKGDFLFLADYFFLTIISVHCLISMMIIRFRGKRIGHLLKMMEENLDAWPIRKPGEYPPPQTFDELRENLEPPLMMDQSQKHPGESVLTHFILKTNWLLVIFSSSSAVIASLFMLNPFFIETPPGVRILPHKGYFLLDDQKSPTYELIYIWLFFGGWVFAFYAALIDISIYSFIRFSSTHYQAIRLRLESLLDANTKNYQIRKELILCVKHHRKLLKFTNYNEETFNAYYLFIYLYTLLTVTFLLLKLGLYKEYNAESYLVALVLMLMIANLYILCHFCQNLTTESELIIDSLYQIDWINLNAETKKIVIIFFRALQKPYYHTTGQIGNISMDMFMGVIRAGYSFFTIIHQIIE